MVINVILGYVVPFILLVAAGYLLKVYRSAEVVKWVGIAVKAAEQIFAHGENSEKFQYVSEWISDKFNISETDLKNLIESAVYELNNTETKK